MSLSLVRKETLENQVANIRGVDGANVTLLFTDNFHQIFNLSVARTALLPSAGIVAGQKIKIENQGAGKLTVQSSGTNQVGIVDSLYSTLECIALQVAPTSAAHWKCNLIYRGDQYLADKAAGTNDIAYNSGNKATISLSVGVGSLSSIRRALFIPYQLIDGIWRCRFNMDAVFDSQTRTSITLAVNGITFKNVASMQIPLAMWTDGSIGAIQGYTIANSNTFTLSNNSRTTTEYGASGDVELDSKPTWAY